MTPSLEGWPTKAKEPPSPHEVRLAPLDTNPVFQSLGEDADCLGTPLQAVMSLAHNQLANLFISSYREATVMKFGQ